METQSSFDVPTASVLAAHQGYGAIPAAAETYHRHGNTVFDSPSMDSLVPPEVMQILHTAQSLSIRHHVKILPKACFACPPCSKQENTFSVYARAETTATAATPQPTGSVGVMEAMEREILRIDEVSDDWSRTCCSPYHPLKLEVRAYIPVPGEDRQEHQGQRDQGRQEHRHASRYQNYRDGTSSININDHDASEAGRVGADLARDWGGFSREEQVMTLRRMYEQEPVLFSFVRDGGQRCRVPPCPCKCLNTCVCFSFCQDGMKVYAGAVPDGARVGEKGWFGTEANTYRGGGAVPDSLLVMPRLPSERLVGSVIQPMYGGWFAPRLDLQTYDGNPAGGRNLDGQQPQRHEFGRVEGPYLFGGWSEMCIPFRFQVSSPGASYRTGDIAEIIKRTPTSVSGALALLAADANNFSIEFNNDTYPVSASEKLTILASQVLLDYMLFDGNTEEYQRGDEGTQCHLCYCSILGCLIPFSLFFPSGRSSNVGS